MADWIYFSYEQDKMLACPCCGKEGMNDSFMHFNDRLRDNIGLPLIVTSGYRCRDYNAMLSRSVAHTTGLSIDVATPNSRYRYLILQELINQGVNRIGIGETFIHWDKCTNREHGLAENVIWTYY